MEFYRHVMYGISVILPFVITGGVLFSIADLVGFGATKSGAGASIAGRAGLMPSMAAGMMMLYGGAGLLGGILAGLVGGYGSRLVSELLRGVGGELDILKSILLHPLMALAICAAVSWMLVDPLTTFHVVASSWLNGLGMPASFMLGLLLGAMMTVDLGGPINKLTYVFAILALGMGYYLPTAAVMAAGMVPPLALSFAVTAFPGKFSTAERATRRSCLLKGASFVPEGAVAHTRRDPRRVLLPCVIGAMLTGALSMAYGCELRVPHGGIFVVPLVNRWPAYICAIVSRVATAGILMGLLRHEQQPAPRVP